MAPLAILVLAAVCFDVAHERGVVSPHALTHLHDLLAQFIKVSRGACNTGKCHDGLRVLTG
jgi:hypothetical protein